MEYDKNRIRDALVHSKDKASRKYLSRLAEALQAEEPSVHAEILSRKDTDGPLAKPLRIYRIANALTVAALIFAAVVIIGAYLVGDFGIGIISGNLGRYSLAFGIMVGMGILALASLFSANCKARLIATALLEEADCDSETEV